MQPPLALRFGPFPLGSQLAGRDDIQQQTPVGMAQRPLGLTAVEFQLALQLWPAGIEKNRYRPVHYLPMHLRGMIEP